MTMAQLVLVHNCEFRDFTKPCNCRLKSMLLRHHKGVMFLLSAGHGMSLDDINAAHAMSLK